MRLNQFLSQSGVTSRRKADGMISRGEVKVNGETCALGTTIDPSQDVVTVLKTTTSPAVWFQVRTPDHTTTYALYKPRGYVTSLVRQTKDPVVASLIPKSPRVFPIGRLDKDTEGLLLLTNDGELANRLTHPTLHVPKTYEVVCITPRTWTETIAKRQLGRLSSGVMIGDYKTQPVVIKIKNFSPSGKVTLDMTIKEGKNRQIRKMMGVINLEVIKLTRIQIGRLTLESLSLAPKEYTTLTQQYLDILAQ